MQIRIKSLILSYSRGKCLDERLNTQNLNKNNYCGKQKNYFEAKRLIFNIVLLLRVKDKNNDLEKEQSTLNAELSKLQLSESNNEENDALRKSNQELEDKLKETSEELDATQEKLQAHDQAAKRAIAALQKEMALRVDQVGKLL